MKQLTKYSLSLLLAVLLTAVSQAQVKPATPGFDEVKTGIAHGKIDTITYASKTVGTNRRALVYTPPGFSKKEKYPVCKCAKCKRKKTFYSSTSLHCTQAQAVKGSIKKAANAYQPV